MRKWELGRRPRGLDPNPRAVGPWLLSPVSGDCASEATQCGLKRTVSRVRDKS